MENPRRDSGHPARARAMAKAERAARWPRFRERPWRPRSLDQREAENLVPSG
jgi:hypothetical protein